MVPTMTAPTCVGCRRECRDARLCPQCVKDFDRALTGWHEAPGLLHLLPALGDAVARLDVMDAPPRRPRTQLEVLLEVPAVREAKDRRSLVANPAPVSFAAIAVRDDVRGTLRAVISELCTVQGLEMVRTPMVKVGPTCQPHTHRRGQPRSGCRLDKDGQCVTPHYCRHPSCVAIRWQRAPDADLYAVGWLQRNLAAVARCDEAGQWLRAILAARRRAERAVDRRDPDVFYGTCDVTAGQAWVDEADTIRIDTDAVCGAELWADLGDDTVTCEACGAVHHVADRKPWLIEKVRDVWERPAAIASALTSLDVPLTAERLDNWISRDRAQYASGRPRKVAYPPILPVSWTVIDAEGDPVLDDDGKPVGKPLFRVGDVMDRLEALKAEKQRKETA